MGNVPVGGRGGEGVVEKVVRSDHSPWPLSEEAAMRQVKSVAGWSFATRWLIAVPRYTTWNLCRSVRRWGGGGGVEGMGSMSV